MKTSLTIYLQSWAQWDVNYGEELQTNPELFLVDIFCCMWNALNCFRYMLRIEQICSKF